MHKLLMPVTHRRDRDAGAAGMRCPVVAVMTFPEPGCRVEKAAQVHAGY